MSRGLERADRDQSSARLRFGLSMRLLSEIHVALSGSCRRLRERGVPWAWPTRNQQRHRPSSVPRYSPTFRCCNASGRPRFVPVKSYRTMRTSCSAVSAGSRTISCCCASVEGVLCASHTGRYVQTWLERRSLGHPAQRAAAGLRDRIDRGRRERARELLALSRFGALCARRPGAYLRCAGVADALAIGRYPGRRLASTSAMRNTIFSIRFFSAADEGVLSLAAIRNARGEPADFQIVHLNQGAAKLLMQPATELLWRRLSAGGNPLAAPHVMDRLRAFVGGGPGEAVRDRQRRSAACSSASRHSATCCRSRSPMSPR